VLMSTQVLEPKSESSNSVFGQATRLSMR
jgi:hypothetical protein